MRLPILMTAAALVCGTALAQTPMPPKAGSPSEIKAQCLAAGERDGLKGDALNDYIKQCVTRGGPTKDQP